MNNTSSPGSRRDHNDLPATGNQKGNTTMQAPDLSYSVGGMFTAFIADTPAGAAAWRTLASQTDGTGKILTAHLPAVLKQLRAAGYRVQKSKPLPIDADALLAELQS